MALSIPDNTPMGPRSIQGISQPQEIQLFPRYIKYITGSSIWGISEDRMSVKIIKNDLNTGPKIANNTPLRTRRIKGISQPQEIQ
jgi:hypothetical protein